MASYITATQEAAQSVLGTDLLAHAYTNAVRSFFSRGLAGVMRQKRTYAEFQEWAKDETGIIRRKPASEIITGSAAITDDQPVIIRDIPLDDWLFQDSRPDRFYGIAVGTPAEEHFLDVFTGYFQSFDWTLDSARHWIAQNPAETRGILRLAQANFCLQRIVQREEQQRERRVEAAKKGDYSAYSKEVETQTADGWYDELCSSFK